MTFALVVTRRFEKQARALPGPVKKQLKKRLERLSHEPRHPSLGTHPVEGAKGDYGGKIFELYVNMKVRATWEYGPKEGEITLRNVDNHDDCLSRP